jgi:prevent-host-death family protein
MATTIGVRDLKNEAPRLVQRAARGEHIVITRYGKPQAILGPVAAAEPPEKVRHAARMADWEREREAFERLSPRMRRRHTGRFVAVHRGRVIATDADHDRLFHRVWKRLRGKTFFIGLAGAEPPIVEVSGFEIP